jgi:hypothetical protein
MQSKRASTDPKDLKTIAEFPEANQARIVSNYLASEGIRAWLSNETIVTNDWLIGNAIGNVRLQVADVDVEQALKLIEEKPQIGLHELSKIALNEDREEPSGPLFDFIYPEGHESCHTESESESDLYQPVEAELALNPREVMVDRAFRASFIFIAVFILSPFLTWMLIDIYTSKDPLSQRHRRRLFWATLLHIPAMVVFILFLRLPLGGF